MAITQERFNEGLTYAEYRASMTRSQDRFDANEQTVEFDADDLAFFAHVPQPLNVLVIAEDWCGDVIANLPVLGRLAAESGTLNLRVFPRDQHLDLMDQYLKQGQFRSIPVFVFFDAAFNELGYWIERPASTTELQAQMRNDLFASDPLFAGVAPDISYGELPEAARDRLGAAFGAFREEHRGFSDREVVRELRALVEHGATQRAEPAPTPSVSSVPQRPAAKPDNAHAPIKVSITYCAACGYEPQTLELAGALMREFVYDLASIELLPWQDGSFDVAINGDLVHSMYREGGFPENATIIEAVRERLKARAS